MRDDFVNLNDIGAGPWREQGRPFDNRAIYLLEFDDTGRWSALRTMDMDHEKINRFWSAVTIPDGARAR